MKGLSWQRRFAAAVLAGFSVAVAGLPLRAQVVVPPVVGMPGARSVPAPGIEAAVAALEGGDFSQALEIASREHQGGIRSGAGRWIDSIATAAALGECHYELGRLQEAVAAYDEALLLATAHANWLLAVQFPPQGLRPMAKPRVATWGRSQRNVAPSAVPGPLTIRLGGADPQDVLQKGGVLTAPVQYPIRPQEIMRSLVMAAYRRGVILGELAREGVALEAAVKTFSGRPAPPNHYSQSWIDVVLGTLLWSQGKAEQAQPLLTRGLLAGNQFDHPLSSWGLIVLGRIALAGDQFAAAARYFEEATFTAADYGDTRALGEAFRLAAAAHLAAGTRGVPPVIRDGSDWARANLPLLRATLVGYEAEALAAVGEPQAAAAALGEVDGRMLRGEPGRGLVGIQHAYAAALAAYAAGELTVGDRELDRALGLARRRSPELFQVSRLVQMTLTGSGISDRQADLLFARLLADPTPGQVAFDPLGSIAVMGAARNEAFEAWVAAATRRGGDAALEAAEAAVRSRWLAAQPFGGGRAAVGCLLAADPERLPQAEATRRAGLLARYPAVAATLDALARARAPLTARLLAAGDEQRGGENQAEAAGFGEPAAWRDYQRLADRCRVSIAEIAAGRGAPPLGMPPLTPTPEIRRRLAPKQLMLSFHWTAGGLMAALESQQRASLWTVRQPAAVAKEVAALAKAMCLYDPLAPVSTERLVSDDWRLPAERLERLLFENSKVVLTEGIDELVVVPDGMLWYLPFELLPVGSARPAAGPARNGRPAAAGSAVDSAGTAADEPDDPPRRLRDICRIRYAPTRSLAVLRFDPRPSSGPFGIHAGRLFRGEKPAVAQEAAARLSGAVDRAVILPFVTQTPPCLPASLCDSLVVLDEIGGDAPVAQRPLLGTQSGRSAATFAEWLAPPAKRPQSVLLPGFQSAMAGGLAKPPARPGEDLFLATTGLVVAGARTTVLSRWRMGGETCLALLEEFLKDRSEADGDPPPACQSWQRAVDTVMREQPDIGREPRLRQSNQEVLIDSRHPFLWAGYLLVDCGGGRYADPPIAAVPPKPPANAPPAAAVAKPAVGPAAGPAAGPANPAAGPARQPLNPAQPPVKQPQGPLNPAQPRPQP